MEDISYIYCRLSLHTAMADANDYVLKGSDNDLNSAYGKFKFKSITFHTGKTLIITVFYDYEYI
jgi:hypothetical protein